MQKATRSDWIVRAIALNVGDALRIQPRETLTVRDAVAALDAQGVAGFRVVEHGTVIFVRRLSDSGENWIADMRGKKIPR